MTRRHFHAGNHFLEILRIFFFPISSSRYPRTSLRGVEGGKRENVSLPTSHCYYLPPPKKVHIMDGFLASVFFFPGMVTTCFIVGLVFIAKKKELLSTSPCFLPTFFLLFSAFLLFSPLLSSFPPQPSRAKKLLRCAALRLVARSRCLLSHFAELNHGPCHY